MISKESRRRSGQCSVPLTGSNDMALLSIDSCWAQMRPHSANQRNNEIVSLKIVWLRK